MIESETKLIAQKNFGPLILAYNFTVEAEWDGEGLREHAGELQQACRFRNSPLKKQNEL